MTPMSLKDVATVTGGRLHNVPDPHVLVTAPPTVDPEDCAGALFVPAVQERPDGRRIDTHWFAARAVGSGAVAVLTERPAQEPAVVVPDSLGALGALAVHVRTGLTETAVIGITGSAGKTSTKDLTAHVLSHVGPTAASPGNHNDRIGLPLAVSSADASARHLVLEVGHHGPGDIRYLSGVARPEVGVVLNVGAAHMGSFGSLDAIAEAKGDLVEALPPHGLAVLNADDPRVRGMAGRTGARVVLAGRTPEAEVRAENVHVDSSGHADFTLRTPEGSAPVALQLVGEHFVADALAAAAVARHFGLATDRTAAALGEVKTLSPRRMEVFERPDGVTVIDDTFNTTPESARASLHALAALANGRQTVAVLGTMHKLGDATREANREVARLVAGLGITGLVVVGGEDAPWLDEGARWLHEAACSYGVESVFVPGVRQARAVLRTIVEPGDVILLKGPRFIRMRDLADDVRGDVTPPEAAGGSVAPG